jgi:glycosyltransferase involved in cell wall biosynthesis
MKIVLTVHQFLPDYCAGTELIAYYQACELRRRGHHVVIVTGHPGRPGRPPQRDHYQYDGFLIHRFHHSFARQEGQTHEFQSEYDHRQVYHWFKDVLCTNRPDIVHCLHLHRLSAAPIDACTEAGIPCLFTATDFWAICPSMRLQLADGSMCRGPERDGLNCIHHLLRMYRRKQGVHAAVTVASWLPKWALRCGLGAIQRGWFAHCWSAAGVRAVAARAEHVRQRLSRVDRIIVPSQTMRELLVANGLPAQRVVWIPYGIPVELMQRATDRGGSGNGQPLRVIYVGQLDEHKGAHVLIQAVRKLPADVPLRVTIHGDPNPRPAYAGRLRHLAGGDGRITFAGGFAHSGIGDVLRQADVLVCPSLWYENTPLVIYEALAAGVPVVATDLPGMAEMVKAEVNGLLFPQGDVGQLAAMLQRLAQEQPLVARLAQQTEMPLSVALHVDRLEEQYRAAVAAATCLT